MMSILSPGSHALAHLRARPAAALILQSPTMPQAMNHDTHTYVAATLGSNSPFLSAPASLSARHPNLSYHGQVGALSDVHLFSVPKNDWLHARDDVLSALKDSDGVVHVEVQELQQRARRGGGGDEL